MTNEDRPKRRGRPKIDVSWPDANFTVKDVITSMMPNPPSNVLVHLKLKEGITNGTVRQVGKKSGPTGRPQNVYRTVTAESQPEQRPAERPQQQEERYSEEW